jgi:hypothetical protein
MSRRLLATVALLLGAAANVASASDPRLEQRLDPLTARIVAAQIDSAHQAHIPTEPLVLRALEGATRGAAGPRIIEAVHAYAQRLAAAQRALGADAPEADLVAGASAIFSGVRPDRLTELQRARRGGSIALATSVLVDLVAKGVPADRAAVELIKLVSRRPDDEAVRALAASVRDDVAGGALPVSAVSRRVAGILVTLPPPLPGTPSASLVPQAGVPR